MVLPVRCTTGKCSARDLGVNEQATFSNPFSYMPHVQEGKKRPSVYCYVQVKVKLVCDLKNVISNPDYNVL